MVNRNVKLTVGIAVILVALFSGVIIRYVLKKDPLTIKRLNDNTSSRAGDVQPDGDDLTTDGNMTFDEDGNLGFIDDSGDFHAVTQSTERQDNRRKNDSGSVSEAAGSSDKKQKAGKELDAAAAKYDDAAAALNAANAALDEAMDNRDRLQEEFDEVSERLENARSNYDDNAAAEYDRGLYAFFESIGADDGLAELNGSRFSSAVEPNNYGDAASVENVRRSIEILKRANSFRADEGRGELMVSYRLLALAVLNNDMSSVSGDPENDTELEQNVAFGMEDPFDLWYYDERDSDGANYRSLMNEDYVAAGVAFSDKNGMVYSLLFADAEYDAGSLISVSQLAAEFGNFYERVRNGRSIADIEEEYERAEHALNEAEQAVADREKEVETAEAALNSARRTHEEKLKIYQGLS